MIKTKFVFAVSLVAILAVSSSMAASVTDVAPATGAGQAISGTTGTVGDVYDWSKWSGYATEGIASVNYVNNAVDAAGNAAQWAENHAAAAGTSALNAAESARQAGVAATEAKGALSSLDVSDTAKTGQYVSAVSQADGKITVSRGNLPTVNNATLTIQRNGETVGTFTANASANKTISITDNDTVYTLPVATANTLGGVKQGANITIGSDGTISAKDTVYTLPAAKADTLGGVKLYTNLGTNQDGTVTQNVVNNLSKDVDSISAKYDTLNGVQTGISSRLEEVEQDINGLVDTKVDIDQGSTNANKIMITNASGSVSPVAITNSGNGSLVTGVSIADGKLTVTKGSSLPTVNNATLTIKNGATNTNLATFTANQSSAATAIIPAATPSVAGLSKIGVIPSGSATSTTYATIWVE